MTDQLTDLAPRPSHDAAVSIHEHGAILLHLEAGRLYRSNRVGAQVWQALDEGQSLVQIASGMSRRYRLPYDTAAAHVVTFIASLEAERLVTRGSTR